LSSARKLIPHHQLPGLTVDRIMVPVADLLRADTQAEAADLHDQYDIVPWPARGPIKGYFHRDDQGSRSLDPDSLLSFGTPITELADLFLHRDFFFVIQANQVAGYIHYSDLNHPYVKIPLFAIIQQAERAVWGKIHPKITPKVLVQMFGEERAGRYEKLRARIREANVELDWTGVFTLPAILEIGRHLKAVKLTDGEIELIRDVRNRIAHSDRTLISKRSDVRTVVSARHLAGRIARSA
jgi:hypothetical protein